MSKLIELNKRPTLLNPASVFPELLTANALSQYPRTPQSVLVPPYIFTPTNLRYPGIQQLQTKQLLD